MVHYIRMIRSRTLVALMMAPLLTSCTIDNPGYSVDGEAGAAGDSGPPPVDLMTSLDIRKCVPGAFLGCKSATQLVRCNASGSGTRTESCPYGCNGTARRCNACGPAWPPKCVGSVLYTCSSSGQIKTRSCPAGCKDGTCNSCTKKTYYRDLDKDGHGDPKAKLSACDKPPGHVTNGADCNDGNPDVHSSQTNFFSSPIPGSTGFDYNCDGKQEQRYPSTEKKCKRQGDKCVGSGWVVYVPPCGGSGVWLECVKVSWGRNNCGEKVGGRKQSCR